MINVYPGTLPDIPNINKSAFVKRIRQARMSIFTRYDNYNSVMTKP